MSQTQDGPLAARIREKLETAFTPVELVVTDQSHLHAGHAGAREHAEAGLGAESHFHVAIVSERFRGLPRVARHRVVQQVLAEDMPRIHALSLDLREPDGPAPDPVSRDPETGKSVAWETKDTTKSTGLSD